MKKHSVSIRGHKTSFSLEDEFWHELQIIVERRQTSLAQLVARIDAQRADGENLSSALRLLVLRELKSKLPET